MSAARQGRRTTTSPIPPILPKIYGVLSLINPRHSAPATPQHDCTLC
ncbi:hypothetical protein [Geobacter benzoatilyticus]|uniref:Uncharacterized protein n=1 Tax=Geobacter benzoatilyticus TaxID=2815309 RepID=A0ABX7Q3E9_9BACT|nr:hypothetical protein [Geobacter benzoatilyticus]QSV45973.1 hypothetical protein JZM60_01365 [Geobacter benzoatilyticus]